MLKRGIIIGTTRKLERAVLRHKFGARYVSTFYKTRTYKPKRMCAFKRGMKNLYKALTGNW